MASIVMLASFLAASTALAPVALGSAAPTPAWPTWQGLLTPVPERKVRFAGIHPQGSDVTCGLAALATVLAHLGEEADEKQLRRLAGLAHGRPASLRHLVVAASRLGYPVYALRSSWAQMRQYFREFREPVVVLLHGLVPHFSVWLDAGPHVAFLADPARGHLTLAREVFESRWTGVTLLVRPNPGFRPGRPDDGEGPGGSDVGGAPGENGPPSVHRPPSLPRVLEAGRQRHQRLITLQARGSWEATRPWSYW